MKRVHFIAIGGSAMHNLAIALHKKGFHVTGSDDEVFEPSYSRLQKHRLLPEANGWHPEKITGDIDAVILGMHARPDNPELQKARELGLKIYSYPEYLYEQTKKYKNSLHSADEAIVFFNPRVVAHKKLPEITPCDVRKAFGNSSLRVINDPAELKDFLSRLKLSGSNLLIMTSGNLGGLDISSYANSLII
ncbi:MAG: mpl [Anaerophaga sp.]|nr:mpl [Anaerophaga sp.]MDK2841419.1 UDP-N-acetylmuramate: L-alanyl-gamma-D-glutamyl-meso-diaminopimelate ligase [Anaerophaga sp.]